MGYTDTDWAETSTSTSGFLFLYGPISWASHKQHALVLSSRESELVAEAACSALLWLMKRLKDFRTGEEISFQIMEENQTCINLSQGEKINAHTKHTDVRYGIYWCMN